MRLAGSRGALTRPEARGDLQIAYRVFGDGPYDVVLVPPLSFSMEVGGNEPRAVAATDRLSAHARVIQFDKRGTGSSDRVAGAPALNLSTAQSRITSPRQSGTRGL